MKRYKYELRSIYRADFRKDLYQRRIHISHAGLARHENRPQTTQLLPPRLLAKILNCRSLVPLLIACTLLAACRGSGDSAKSIQETTQARTVSAGPAVPTENSESCKPGGIFLFSGKHEGVIQSDLESAGAVFSAAEDCHTVLLNVRSAQKAHLIARAASYLVASRRVVIDTNGSDEEIALAADIARTLAGAGTTTAGISIVQIQEGVMAVTPIETEDAYRQRRSVSRKPASKGNTARYVLGLN